MTIIHSENKNNISAITFPVGPLGANCTIIYSDKSKEAVIIDPGSDATMVMEKVEELNLRVLKLIHTHGHFDHSGDASTIKKKTSAKIYLHKEDLELYTQGPNHAALYGFQIGPVGEVDKLFTESDQFEAQTDDTELNKLIQHLQIIHTPGHTPGGTCLFTDYFDRPLLFAGDTLFRGSIGRTDLPGGSFEQLVSSIKTKLLLLEESTVVIPGHGPITTIEYEKVHNPFLN